METEVTGAPAEAIDAPVVPAPEQGVAPVPAAAPEPEPKAPETRRETLERAFKNPTNRGKHAAYQPREGGKFAPGAPQRPPEPPAPVVQRPALLKSLKKELEPHWNAAPPELLNAFAQREADFERGATEWKSKTEQASAVLDQFKPYEWILRNEGSTPEKAIGPLLQTAAILRTGTPQQKAQSVAQVMQQFGIPVEHVQQLLGGAQQPAMSPEYNVLAQQVQALQQNWQQTTQQQQLAQEQLALTAIQQFAADPANSFFPQVEHRMLALLQTPHLLGEDVQFMSAKEKLKLAYDAAVRLDPNLSSQVAAQQQAQAQAEARARAQAAANTAKAAAVQVTGAPGSPLPAAVNPTDRRAVIANALRQANA